jgi:hypothetical protein
LLEYMKRKRFYAIILKVKIFWLMVLKSHSL